MMAITQNINLSKEATDELVRLLYLLIDDIQFSQYRKSLRENPETVSGTESKNTPEDDFDVIGILAADVSAVCCSAGSPAQATSPKPRTERVKYF